MLHSCNHLHGPWQDSLHLRVSSGEPTAGHNTTDDSRGLSRVEGSKDHLPQPHLRYPRRLYVFDVQLAVHQDSKVLYCRAASTGAWGYSSAKTVSPQDSLKQVSEYSKVCSPEVQSCYLPYSKLSPVCSPYEVKIICESGFKPASHLNTLIILNPKSLQLHCFWKIYLQVPWKQKSQGKVLGVELSHTCAFSEPNLKVQHN